MRNSSPVRPQTVPERGCPVWVLGVPDVGLGYSRLGWRDVSRCSVRVRGHCRELRGDGVSRRGLRLIPIPGADKRDGCTHDTQSRGDDQARSPLPRLHTGARGACDTPFICFANHLPPPALGPPNSVSSTVRACHSERNESRRLRAFFRAVFAGVSWSDHERRSILRAQWLLLLRVGLLSVFGPSKAAPTFRKSLRPVKASGYRRTVLVLHGNVSASRGGGVRKRAGKVAFSGRLAQLVRAAGLQPAGRGFESLSAHSLRLTPRLICLRSITAELQPGNGWSVTQ